jgi:Protein of unknown function (DUF2723)
LGGLAAFAGPLVVFLASLDPDVGFWDTAEMNTVPYILGLAHPTGFPTEILTGWLFSHTLPFGAVALRLSLLNALEMAGASLLAYLFVQGETRDNPLALFAAFGFALTPVVWQHAIHTDVMSLTVLLVAAALLLVRQWWRNAQPRRLYAAALAGGLAAGTHGAALLYMFAPAIVVTRRFFDQRLKRGCLAALLIFAGTAAAVYAYLPLRSAYVVAHALDPTARLGLPPGRPFWDWGDPRSPSGFIDVISGRDIGAGAAASGYLRPTLIGYDLAYGARALHGGMGSALAFIVAALCVAALFEDAPLAIFLIAPTAFVTPFIANFAAESDPQRYYILPIWGLWVAAALGAFGLLGRLARFDREHRLRTAGVLCVVGALVLWQLLSHRAIFSGRSDRLGASYITALLARTPSDAIIIAPWDYATPIAYAAYAESKTGARILVPGEADAIRARIPGWLAARPVYAVSERAPALAAQYVCNFNVSPGSARDPKLYRIDGRRPGSPGMMPNRPRLCPTFARSSARITRRYAKSPSASILGRSTSRSFSS